MQRLYKSRARKERRRASLKRADAEAIQIEGPQCRKRARMKHADAEAFQIKSAQREEKGENKKSGC